LNKHKKKLLEIRKERYAAAKYIPPPQNQQPAPQFVVSSNQLPHQASQFNPSTQSQHLTPSFNPTQPQQPTLQYNPSPQPQHLTPFNSTQPQQPTQFNPSTQPQHHAPFNPQQSTPGGFTNNPFLN
jgi:hypothetical protein